MDSMERAACCNTWWRTLGDKRRAWVHYMFHDIDKRMKLVNEKEIYDLHDFRFEEEYPGEHPLAKASGPVLADTVDPRGDIVLISAMICLTIIGIVVAYALPDPSKGLYAIIGIIGVIAGVVGKEAIPVIARKIKGRIES